MPICLSTAQLALADMIDGLSGSAELMLTMSRFGICSSRDTLQRLKTNVFNQRHESGMQHEVATGAFSITSIENIDRAAPSTRITPTNQQRGFHGTSIQHVAPKPGIELQIDCRGSSSTANGIYGKSRGIFCAGLFKEGQK